jgi:hypothetical protein
MAEVSRDLLKATRGRSRLRQTIAYLSVAHFICRCPTDSPSTKTDRSALSNLEKSICSKTFLLSNSSFVVTEVPER